MHRILLTTASALTVMLVINGAKAAEVAVFSAPALVTGQAPAPTWAGPYVGIHGGYGRPYFTGFWDNPEYSEGCPCWYDDGGAVDFLAAPGVLGGVHAGFNFQRNALVLGIEVDASVARLGTEGHFLDPNDGTLETSGHAFLSVDLLASVRARLGVAMGNIMPYVTVGVGYIGAEFGANTSDSHPVTTNTVDLSGFGLVLGGGAEWRANDRISLRAEFLHYRANVVQDVRGLGDGNTEPENVVTFNGVSTLRLGMSFSLGR